MSQEFGTSGWMGVGSAIVAVALLNLGLEWLWRMGDKRVASALKDPKGGPPMELKME
jgi:hypothetical protein